MMIEDGLGCKVIPAIVYADYRLIVLPRKSLTSSSQTEPAKEPTGPGPTAASRSSEGTAVLAARPASTATT